MTATTRRAESTGDEYAAWCEIAMLCESCKKATDFLVVDHGDETRHRWWVDGLCAMVHDLGDCSEDTEAMQERMDAHEPASRYAPYWWPHTPAGWRSRAKFAWKMAAECAKEMEAHDAIASGAVTLHIDQKEGA